MNDGDRFADRGIHLGLRELLGGERPPDLAVRVRQRLFDHEPIAPRAQRRANRLVAAAVIVLGVLAVWAVGGLGAPDRDTGAVPQGPDDLPPPVRATPHELDDLPEDTRSLVLLSPTNEDLARLGRFHELVALELSRARGGSITLPVTDEGVAHLAKLSKLRVLRLHWCEHLSAAGLELLRMLPTLQELSLTGSRMFDDALEPLARLPSLESLVLSGVPELRDESLDHVSQIASLTRLDLHGQMWLTPDGLVKLASLRRLRQLDLRSVGAWTISSRQPPAAQRAAGVDDKVLEALSELPALEVLRLASADKVTGKGIEHLRALRKLRVLDLSHVEQLSDPDLMAVRSSLEELDLTGCTRITGHALHAFPALRVLILDGCRALEEDALGETPAENLRELSLRYCDQLEGGILASLPFFHRLERLDLGKCEWVRDEHIETIAELRRLERLSLDGCRQVTDAGLAHLVELDHLEVLDLRANPNVTTDGLRRLEALPLARLVLAACGRITDEAVAELQTLWPECTIER